MILVKKWKYLLCSFLDRIGLKIMFDDHYVKEKAFLDKKKFILHSCHSAFFRGLTHDFGHNMEISSLFVFGQNRP